jgi:thioredoxin reductase (NADPH)
MKAQQCDLVIVGCGPAGISAAIWADDLHLRAVTLELDRHTGGQLRRVYNAVSNYPGIDALNGEALAEVFARSLVSRPVDFRLESAASSIDSSSRSVVVGRDSIVTRFVVLATGVRPRTLDVPGADAFAGLGVHGSATRHADDYVHARVVVVGGGDAALEEALILANVCEEVTIVHRRAAFSGRTDFRARVAANARIVTLLDSRVLAIGGMDRVEWVRIATPEGERELRTNAVFPCLGVEPNSELVRSLVALDERGFVVTNERQRTTLDWIYAAGDVCSHSSLTVASAVGQGAAAVKDISRRLVANE